MTSRASEARRVNALTHMRRRLGARLQALTPALTAAATLGLAAWMYLGDDRRGAIVGFAQAVPEAVAPVELGRVKAVHVAVGDLIKPGQLVATLDTTQLDAELALAQAEKGRVEAEARAEQALLEQQLDLDLEALERTRSLQREEQLRARAEARVLDGQIARVRRLVEDRQAVLGDLSRLDVQQAAAATIAAEKPHTVGLLNRQINAAEQRRQRLKNSALAAKLQADLEVAQRQIERLERRRATHELRASRGGRVVSINRQPGEVAAAGEVVVSLVSARERVVACLPERVALGASEGDVAKLWPRGQSGQPLAGSVVAMGPVVAELPSRCRIAPSVPVWGREITVRLEPPVDVVAGQAFDLLISPRPSAEQRPWVVSAVVEPAQSPPPSPPLAPPSKIAVPEGLAKRTRFEPSGLLTRPGESRLLVVSDDTGHDGRDEGLPWVFAMSAAGVVEPAPIELKGVSKVDDLEAITAGEGGEIYLLASQSFSKKGKRKPARTALLRARPEGPALKVDGEVHLAELLDADPDQAASLGLPGGTRALDIEGMGFAKGALYLGLKAPLDAQGDAMIWRLGSPSALFAAASSQHKRRPLQEAGATLWAHVRVDVELGGQATPGGISELLFLPDGTLVLASTPSTAEGEAGALWRVDQPTAGKLSPRLLRRFADLKPEGLAPSPNAGKLLVVFDTGSAPPLWTEVPWSP